MLPKQRRRACCDELSHMVQDGIILLRTNGNGHELIRCYPVNAVRDRDLDPVIIFDGIGNRVYFDLLPVIPVPNIEHQAGVFQPNNAFIARGRRDDHLPARRFAELDPVGSRTAFLYRHFGRFQNNIDREGGDRDRHHVGIGGGAHHIIRHRQGEDIGHAFGTGVQRLRRETRRCCILAGQRHRAAGPARSPARPGPVIGHGSAATGADCRAAAAVKLNSRRSGGNRPGVARVRNKTRGDRDRHHVGIGGGAHHIIRHRQGEDIGHAFGTGVQRLRRETRRCCILAGQRHRAAGPARSPARPGPVIGHGSAATGAGCRAAAAVKLNSRRSGGNRPGVARVRNKTRGDRDRHHVGIGGGAHHIIRHRQGEDIGHAFGTGVQRLRRETRRCCILAGQRHRAAGPARSPARPGPVIGHGSAATGADCRAAAAVKLNSRRSGGNRPGVARVRNKTRGDRDRHHVGIGGGAHHIIRHRQGEDIGHAFGTGVQRLRRETRRCCILAGQRHRAAGPARSPARPGPVIGHGSAATGADCRAAAAVKLNSRRSGGNRPGVARVRNKTRGDRDRHHVGIGGGAHHIIRHRQGEDIGHAFGTGVQRLRRETRRCCILAGQRHRAAGPARSPARPGPVIGHGSAATGADCRAAAAVKLNSRRSGGNRPGVARVRNKTRGDRDRHHVGIGGGAHHIIRHRQGEDIGHAFGTGVQRLRRETRRCCILAGQRHRAAGPARSPARPGPVIGHGSAATGADCRAAAAVKLNSRRSGGNRPGVARVRNKTRGDRDRHHVGIGGGAHHIIRHRQGEDIGHAFGTGVQRLRRETRRCCILAGQRHRAAGPARSPARPGPVIGHGSAATGADCRAAAAVKLNSRRSGGNRPGVARVRNKTRGDRDRHHVGIGGGAHHIIRHRQGEDIGHAFGTGVQRLRRETRRCCILAGQRQSRSALPVPPAVPLARVQS